jgi:hypothetical protein
VATLERLQFICSLPLTQGFFPFLIDLVRLAGCLWKAGKFGYGTQVGTSGGNPESRNSPAYLST